MSNKVWAHHGSWFLVTAPSRPATWQLAAIRGWLSSLPASAHIAILGSTPEFQDLVSDFEDMQLTVIDRSESFHRHVRCQRRRPSSQDASPRVVLEDWTTGLLAHKESFDAILSDLTSGNVPYDRRARWYEAIHGALKPGGFFADRVLTLEGSLHARQELYRTFDRTPLNIRSLNELNCRLLFTSDLLVGSEVVDVSSMLSIIRQEWTSPAADEYLNALPLITPTTGRWWYGKPWTELKEAYAPGLTPADELHEPEGSAYHSHCRLFRLVKGPDRPAMPSPEATLANIRRSRTAAVLEECKLLIDQLALPGSGLGESFLGRLTSRAVELRDSCLSFRAERLVIDRDHWQFMEGLFTSIEGKPEGREQTYAFCWCYSPESPLFHPDSPEWKTLFTRAIRLASTRRLTVRALLVTDAPDCDRMRELARLAHSLSPRFDVRFLPPKDFQPILDSAELHGVVDFGVFGQRFAFTTSQYVPRVSGMYVWALEEVIRLHDLFDRVWDQARPSHENFPLRGGTIDDWIRQLEESDRLLPLSYIAAIVQHGGGSLSLNESELDTAFRDCAGLCSAFETELRQCIKLALSRKANGDRLLRTFIERLRHVAPAGARVSGKSSEDIIAMLETLTLWQEWEFVQKHWRALEPPWRKEDVHSLFREANDRPHAHARTSLDLGQFVAYRSTLNRLRIWTQGWLKSLKEPRNP